MDNSQNKRTRFDWYQTEQTVVITIFSEGIKEEDVEKNITENTLDLTIKLQSGSEYVLDIELCGKIIPEKTTIKYYQKKIDIIMIKATKCKWNKLEHTNESNINIVEWADTSSVDKNQYPSSNPRSKGKNWDSIGKDEIEENDFKSFLKNISLNGDPETRKAIEKSYLESGGTVIDCNWDKVGNEEIKPVIRDGVQLKKWSEV